LIERQKADGHKTPALSVPFKEPSSLFGSSFNLPAAIRDGESLLQLGHDLPRYLDLELKTPKLDQIQSHLWLAGLPRCARSLHRQELLGRTIIITEDVNEHLVWVEERFFVKPLPQYLLSFEFWRENLCADVELHKSACGFLLSYAWLVCQESDYRIAMKLGLIPKAVEWEQWTKLVADFLGQIDLRSLKDVSDRYKYGELRLTRLNKIYRLILLSPKNLVYGYMSASTWYKSLFSRNFAWLLAVFAYLTVILSALQVGLATSVLQGSEAFQSASYGFAVTSVVAVAVSVFAIFLVWLFLFVYHVFSAWRNDRHVSRKRARGHEL
jgi:hypothetical protein